ncbi:MAG: amino acid ABC transporter substrate-binding protein [Acuticoccus sp.]
MDCDMPKDPRTLAAATLAAAMVAALPAGASADEDGVLKIGAPLALTGGLADEGKKQQDVWNLWLKKLKEKGGLTVNGETLPIEIIEYDYQTEGNRAGQLAEKLITDDGVDVLMAPFGSGHTKIVSAVAERYQVPLLACVSSSVAVYDQGFSYLFGTLAPNAGITESMVSYFKENMPELKSIAIYGRDDVFPRSMAASAATAAEEAGIDIVYNELYAVGTMDHAAALSAIKAADPDWIYMTGYTQDLILGRKQIADLDAGAPIISMLTGPAYREFTEGLGELADGVTSATWWHHATNYTDGYGVWPTTQDFYKDFTDEFGVDPDYVHASCAAAAEVVVKAVSEAGGTDKQAVRDALAATDMMTFYGPIKFGDNGMNQSREEPIIQVQGEDIKVLFPPIIKDADFQVVE